jgi:hypothetical protein
VHINLTNIIAYLHWKESPLTPEENLQQTKSCMC